MTIINTLPSDQSTEPFEKAAKLYLSLETTTDLAQSYMPFVQQGGIFIPTQQRYRLGQSLEVELRLMTEHYVMLTTVIWITPQGAQQERVTGVGVQFPTTIADRLCAKIEQYLSDVVHSKILSHTL